MLKFHLEILVSFLSMTTMAFSSPPPLIKFALASFSNSRIDTLILACTHYPILKESIIKYLPSSVMVFDQGDLVAKKLTNYFKRHPIVNNHLSKDGKIEILTTEKSEKFDSHLNLFYNSNYTSKTVQIN